jgi:hypothetical protein
VLSKKPNSAFSKFSRIGRGEFLVRHRAHPLSVLLSGKPGAVQSRPDSDFMLPAWKSTHRTVQ